MIEGFDDVGGFVLFAIGRTPVTLGGVLSGLLLIVAGFLIARVAGAGIRRVRGRVRVGAEALYIVEKLVTYAVVIVFFVAGLSTVGLNLSSLAVFAGAVGVGVGLGLQGVVKEFVSGLVLIFDRVLNVGDYVELEDGKRGLVQEIGPRAVRVRTNDNIDIVVPNSKFIEGPVINWTLHNETRRIHIPFSVDCSAERHKVREVVLAAARAVPFTSPETETRKSQVWLTAFGDGALKFELLVWPTLDAVKRPATMHAAYTWAIADALECAGLAATFPEMKVRLRQGEDETARPARRGPAPDPTRLNDAAEDLSRPMPELDAPVGEARPASMH